MSSEVYFIRVKNEENSEIIKYKLKELLQRSKLFDFILPEYKVVIKMHFGEEGNTGFVKPEYVRVIVDKIKEKGAGCVLADTNTLYKGKRTNSQDHLDLAYEHGFKEEICGCKVVIPDDKTEDNFRGVNIQGEFIKKAKIAALFLDADVFAGIAHFKGHLMTGFGGALKNVGMGCASREGKLAQHCDVAPFVNMDLCVGCGKCVEICLPKAISLRDNKATIDSSKCIGCANCIAVCPQGAIDVDWESGGGNIQEKMVEYARAVLENKKERKIFLNFLIKITQECDCLAKDDPRIVPDIGILASSDPVSIDRASYDLVNRIAGRDIFKEIHPLRDGSKQLRYASMIGLGNLEYNLIEIK